MWSARRCIMQWLSLRFNSTLWVCFFFLSIINLFRFFLFWIFIFHRFPSFLVEFSTFESFHLPPSVFVCGHQFACSHRVEAPRWPSPRRFHRCAVALIEGNSRRTEEKEKGRRRGWLWWWWWWWRGFRVRRFRSEFDRKSSIGVVQIRGPNSLSLSLSLLILLFTTITCRAEITGRST